MAQTKKSSKRYATALLLASVCAETAHAPLHGNAMGSDQLAQSSGKHTDAKTSLGKQNKKTPLTVDPLNDVASAEQSDKPVREKMRELFSPLPLLPPTEVGANLPHDGGADSVSLLHTGRGDESGPEVGASVGGGDPDVGGSLPTDGVVTVPQARVPVTILGDPGISPTQNNPVVGVVDPIASVPEPAGFTMLLGGAILLCRRKSRA